MKSASTVDWARRFSRRAREMKSSVLRELLEATARPGMISFAGGLPGADLFPVERIQAGVQETLRRLGGRALQYGETEGVPELRDWLARRYSTTALKLTRENVLITTGAQQAIDLVGRVMLDDKDSVVVENPTYLNALLAWQPFGAEFLPVEIDKSGMNVEEAAPYFERGPKMAYVIPNFQNPTGVCLTLERKKRLVELAQTHDVVLLEDEPYAELRYDSEATPSLLELDRPPDEGGRVIRIGTFSKTLVPGFRIGWIVGPKAALERMGRAKQAMDLHTSTFNQYVALDLVSAGYLEDTIPILRAAYGERRDAMLDALESYFPAGSRWMRPQGGMFIFVTLPSETPTAEILSRALERNVAFVPGDEFYLTNSGKNTMRLNFTKTGPGEIREGIRRLAEVIKST